MVSASSHSQYEIQLGDIGCDPKCLLTSLMFGNQAPQIQLLKFNQNIMISFSHHINTIPMDGQKSKNIYEKSNHTSLLRTGNFSTTSHLMN